MSARLALHPGVVEERVRSLFRPAGPPSSVGGVPAGVGLELELSAVRCAEEGPVPVAPADVVRCLAADPALIDDGRVSFEPGGQVELSPAPRPGAAEALEGIDELEARLRRCGAEQGITFVAAAVSPWHDADAIGLQNRHPRYLAMQRHFDSIGPEGRRMMRQTCALQICLDLDGEHRWRLLNQAGPALAAAFAGSPLLDGRPAGARSARVAIWQRVDPSRTGFDGRHVGDEPEPGYSRLALDAEAIPMPRRDGVETPSRTPLRSWMEQGGPRPDEADIDHHLTTLFPPVRPRGYLEVRYLDGLPRRWRAVPVCLLAALTADAAACRQALEAIPPGARPAPAAWSRAAASGMADGELRSVALRLFDAAIAAAGRLPSGYLPSGAAAVLAEYRERFPSAGRCPADDLLERFTSRPEDVTTWI